jgi:branched-chain amino acid transport system substrate-binding protein
MNIAVKDVNAAGGVLGKPIDLVVEDSQSDPTAALNAAKKLIDVDKVDAIVGTFSSSETLPILSFTTQAKIPVLTVSGAPEISDIGKKTGMIYRFVVTEGIFGEAYAVYARKAGYSKAYVLASDNAAERDAAKKFTARFKKEGGDVLGTTIFEPNQSNYNSEVSAALAGNPDVIVVAAYTNDAITIAKTVHQLDPDVKIIGPLYSLGNDFLKAVGPQVAEGTLSIDAMPAESSAAYAGFAPLYKAATGDEPTANPYAVMDYDMIITLSLAADAAKSTDPAKFVPFIRMVANPPGLVVSSYTAGLEALKEGKKIDYNGASSPVDFDDSGDLKSMFLRTFKIESGKIVATGSIAP